jgi:hypothetical protein
MIFLTAAIVAASLAAHCNPAPGESLLWANSQTRYVIIGEVHGTAQTPALFADLACAAHMSGRPVVVGIEISATAQPALDTFLASDGGVAARARFLASPIWHFPFKDGRSSRAYLQLIERLRRLKRAGLIQGVRAIQPSDTAASDTQNQANAAMADRIRAAGSGDPRTLVLVLVGNFHARKRASVFETETIVTAAADLPQRQTLSLSVTTTGEAWNCVSASATSCGPHAQPEGRPIPRGVTLSPTAGGDYDGFIGLGVPATASPPAVVGGS